MTDKEPSVRDKIMELYLKYGEREFSIQTEEYYYGIAGDRRYFRWANPKDPSCTLVKITRKALKLIGKN